MTESKSLLFYFWRRSFCDLSCSLKISIHVLTEPNIFTGHMKLVKIEMVRRCGDKASSQQEHPAALVGVFKCEERLRDIHYLENSCC